MATTVVAGIFLLGLILVIPPRIKGFAVLFVDGVFIYTTGYDPHYGFYWDNLSHLGQFIAIGGAVIGAYWLVFNNRTISDEDPEKRIKKEESEEPKKDNKQR